MPFDPQLVTDETRDAYRRDGAVKVEAVFDQHWLEKLASGVADDVAEPGPLHTLQLPAQVGTGQSQAGPARGVAS